MKNTTQSQKSGLSRFLFSYTAGASLSTAAMLLGGVVSYRVAYNSDIQRYNAAERQVPANIKNVEEGAALMGSMGSMFAGGGVAALCILVGAARRQRENQVVAALS